VGLWVWGRFWEVWRGLRMVISIYSRAMYGLEVVLYSLDTMMSKMNCGGNNSTIKVEGKW
jgi:hypothetical protein